MIEITKAILHILDATSGMSVASQKEISPDNGVALSYLARHIEKAFSNATVKTGELKTNTFFMPAMNSYLEGARDFVAFSQELAETAWEILGRCEQAEPTDFVLCDFNMEGQRGIALFLFYNKTAFTHYVQQEGEATWVDIIRHQALLPSGTQKVESFAIVNPATREVHFTDRKVQVDGKDTCIIPDLLVGCTSGISSRETLQIVEKAVKTAAESSGKDPAVAVSRAKSYISANTSLTGELTAEEMAKEIFHDDPTIQQKVIETTRENGVPQTAKVNTAYAARKSRVHKIRTDTGIELSIPVEYFENPEFVEFINNPDGTIAIELKNIGEIRN